MDIRTERMAYLSVFILCVGYINGEYMQNNWGRVVTGEYCDYETFQASCNKDEIIVMGRAMYGQMAIGRCVEFDTGHIGCQANVYEVLDGTCSGKTSCKIRVDDEALRQTSPCRRGLGLYLEASYACIKVIPQSALCKPISAKITTSYIASTQAKDAACTKATGLYSQEFTITALPGQNILLTLIDLSAIISKDQQVTKKEIGYVLDSESDAISPITIGDRTESVIATTKTHKASVYIASDPENSFLISFQVSGCPDLKLSSDKYVKRENDKLVVSCPNTKQTWQLKCRGTHWIGVIGNCTIGQPMAAKVEEKIEYTWGSVLPKDIILAIIGCATLFIAILVVTIGYVYLKWPSERRKQTLKNDIDYQTMSKAKAYHRGGGDIVYLAPTQGNTVNTEPQSDYQPIWQKPLPTVPNTEPTTLRVATAKRNNEDVYNMSLSSNSTDYEKKKYFVLDKDYMNTAELQQINA